MSALCAEQKIRKPSLVAAGGIHVALLYLLVTGLGIDVPAKLDEAMQLIEIGPPPPPPIVATPRPLPKRAARPEGVAGAAAIDPDAEARFGTKRETSWTGYRYFVASGEGGA